MFVITADQVDSRHSDDLVEPTLDEIAQLSGPRLILPAERTAGDEIQAATEEGETALEVMLHLVAAGTWSVGLGIGDLRLPLPDSTRAMGGSAFVAARTAVDAAKNRSSRFALAIADNRSTAAATLEPVIDLLLALRQRRTPEGWELHDLLSAGLTQAEAAQRLGISPQAASLRGINAGLRLDREARAAIATLLRDADERIAA